VDGITIMSAGCFQQILPLVYRQTFKTPDFKRFTTGRLNPLKCHRTWPTSTATNAAAGDVYSRGFFVLWNPPRLLKPFLLPPTVGFSSPPLFVRHLTGLHEQPVPV
jgi:hypothetical protein